MNDQKKAYTKPEAVFISKDSPEYKQIMRLLQEKAAASQREQAKNAQKECIRRIRKITSLFQR